MVEILRKMSVRGSSARRGLTLLELVVVMAVLACLAGILVPVASSMIYRSHAATAATNNVEVTKAVQLYASLTNQQYPNQLDSIVDAKTGAGTPAQIATYVLYGQDAGTLAQLTFGTLLPTEVQALAAAGITTVAPMVENPNKPNTNGDYQNDWSATFFPYGNDSTATPTFAAPSAAAIVPAAVVTQKFGTNWTSTGSEKYVVFGLGKYSTIVGTGMDDAPVFYNPGNTNGTSNDPNTTYSRFGLVFQVDNASGVLGTANFVGVVALTQYGVMGRDDNLNFYYSQTK